jgi:hypothetical protein
MKGDKKKYILRLIKNINKSKRRVKRGLYPLDYEDQGWRVVLPRSLEAYDFLPSGRKLLDMAVYDLAGNYGYYWIPLKPSPPGVITPALRLMMLAKEAKA